MRCQWQMFINLLPHRMRSEVDRQGSRSLQELRLRLGQPPQLITAGGEVWLDQIVKKEDMDFCINAASGYSPWSTATLADGYITAPGGHRLGVCGEFIQKSGIRSGIQAVSSVCLRVARDFPQIARKANIGTGSALVIGPPGSGKTTFLRDLIRISSDCNKGSVAVIDEKRELFPTTHEGLCFPAGKSTDILSGCPKKDGIEIALRNMGPRLIAVDEITAAEDCEALIHAGWCGVQLLATAHASSRDDLHARSVYKPLVALGLFDLLIVMGPDKSWTMERMSR